MTRQTNVLIHLDKVWVFTFTGSGCNKYSNELLKLTCNFEFEYSPELQEAVKNNWLCNLTGIEGCWFLMDLLQEKNIKQLKKMVQRRDATFGGNFFQTIVALNIQAFLQVISSMRTMARLGDKGGTHRRQKKQAAMRELWRHMEEHGLHRFRAGHNQGHSTQDDFEAGYDRFDTTPRITDFISRTLRNAGAIHDSGDDITHTMPMDVQDDGPIPNVVVDGTLVISDENASTNAEEEQHMNVLMNDHLLAAMDPSDSKDASKADGGADDDTDSEDSEPGGIRDYATRRGSSYESGDSSVDEGIGSSGGTDSSKSAD